MAHPIVVTDENFDTEVHESKVPVLVDFYADWCGPCKVMAPIVEELAKEYEGKAKIAKLDVDANPKVSSLYRVRSIPTFVIFDGGKPVAQAVGAVAKAALDKGLNIVLDKVKAA